MALRAVPEHPKFAALKLELGLKKFHVLGILEALWHFTGKFCPRGNVGKFTDKQIEAWIEWDGEPGKLIDALKLCEWIDAHPEHRLIVHDWHEHADSTTKKQLGRTGAGFVLDMSGHVQDMSGTNGKMEGPPEPEPEPEPVPVPEQKTLASTANAVPADKGKLLGTLPLNDGSEWEVYSVYVESLVPLYSAVDVRQELRSMKGWLIGNPKFRKTRGGIKRFISAWLEKEQDKARPGGLGNGANHRVPESKWEAARKRILEEPEMDQGEADDDGRAPRGPDTIAGRPDGLSVSAEWLF